MSVNADQYTIVVPNDQSNYSGVLPIWFWYSYYDINTEIYTDDVLAYNGTIQKNPLFFDLPDGNGSLNVKVYMNNSLVSDKNIEFNTAPIIQDLPNEITLSYNWESYWFGETQLEVTLSNNRKLNVDYKIITDKHNGNLKPYSKPFKVNTKISGFSMQNLLESVNSSRMSRWQSWLYTPNYSAVDGVRLNYNLGISWENLSLNPISLQYTSDEDGGGTKTVLSYSDIGTFVSNILDFIDQHKDSSSSSLDFSSLIYIEILSIVILKRKLKS